MAAASGHHEDVVRILLQHMGGRGLDAADKNGRTALHLAARGGVEPGVVRALLRAGADASVTDCAGKTPRARAEECDRARCVYVLEVSTRALRQVQIDRPMSLIYIPGDTTRASPDMCLRIPGILHIHQLCI